MNESWLHDYSMKLIDIIPANSLTASSVWAFRRGCFVVFVGGLSNPTGP